MMPPETAVAEPAAFETPQKLAGSTSEPALLAQLGTDLSAEQAAALDALPPTFPVVERKLFYNYTQSANFEVSFDQAVSNQVAAEIKAKFAPHHKVSAAGHAKLSPVEPEASFELPDKSAPPFWLLRGLVDYGTVEYWPFFVPATLSLLDSPDAGTKAQGCLAARSIATLYKDKLVLTGLQQVFVDAVAGCLHYLPPASTPEETMEIERPAVLCLLDLATSDEQRDRAMRDGPLRALKFVQQNVKLIIYLLELVEAVAERLQTRTIVHLEGLIHIFMAVMADPFIDTSSELVDAACSMVSRVVVRFCGPRISHYRYDILYGFAKAGVLAGPYFDEFKLAGQITAEEVLAVQAAVAAGRESRADQGSPP